jgi:hypothetical protein
MIMPSYFVSLLFNVNVKEGAGIILTMIAGAAIFSLSVIVWLVRPQTRPLEVVIMLFLYNLLLTAIVIYGAVVYSFHGGGLWLVIIFHFIQTVACGFFWKKMLRLKIKL